MCADGAADGFAANDDMDGDDEDGGPSMSLSALEEKLKPEVLANFEEIENLYKKLHKMQHRRLETITSGEEMSTRSEKGYEKIREELVEKVGQVRLHNNRIEELVSQLKLLNQRLTTLEGQLMRMAESCKVNREDFLKHYRGAGAGSELAGAGRAAARQGLEGVRHQAPGRHRQDPRRRSPRWRPMPACRSPSSAAST